MAWRFVRQPDGKLARWSDPVDDFTHYNLAWSEAFEVARQEGLSEEDARAKVERGVKDQEPWSDRVPGDGTARWRDCLYTMGCMHTKRATDKTLNEMGFPDWIPFVDKVRSENEAEHAK